MGDDAVLILDTDADRYPFIECPYEFRITDPGRAKGINEDLVMLTIRCDIQSGQSSECPAGGHGP